MQNDLTQRVANVSDFLQFAVNQTNVKIFDVDSLLTMRIEDNFQKLQTLEEYIQAENKNISSKFAIVQAQFRQSSLSLLDAQQSLQSLNQSLKHGNALLMELQVVMTSMNLSLTGESCFKSM